MTTTNTANGASAIGAGARGLSRTQLVLVRRDDEAPLAIAGVCAHGDVARELIRALGALDDATLRHLRGVIAHGKAAQPRADVVVVTGPAELLPWRDGVRYLGQLVPGLYVPTTRTTSLPPSLAAEALTRHLPAALVDMLLVPLRGGLPLSRAALAHLTSGER